MTDPFDDKAKSWDDPARMARAGDVAKRIEARIPLGRDTRLLDFGSGTGLLGFHFAADVASVTFADPSEGMLREVERKLREGGHTNGRTVRVDPDAPELPERYDVVVSLMTLHHVADPDAVVELLAAHVEPGGWLALCDLDTEDGTFHDDQEMDVHLGFDRNEMASAIAALGFDNVALSTPHVVRRDRPGGVREYPLFLLTAQRAS